MATIYRERDSGYKSESEYIPYSALAPLLFANIQNVIPFLGAGASLLGSQVPEPSALTEPQQEKVDKACIDLGLDFTGSAARFLEAAIRIAWKMNDKTMPSHTSAVQRIKLNVQPPTSSELAEVFAERGEFDWFEQPARKLKKLFPSLNERLLGEVCRAAAQITGVASTAPPLLVAASYYTHKRLGAPIYDLMKELLLDKSSPTATHLLVASAAWHYIQGQPWKNYLIVTTNYDRLMEAALDLAEVPYLVVAVEKKNLVPQIQFSALVQKNFESQEWKEWKESTAISFEAPPKPLIILYKMHGCIISEKDSIIVSDEDYVEFMRRDGPTHLVIPPLIKTLMNPKSFWFMGYSFSDWNVRGIYNSLTSRDFHASDRKYDDCVILRYVNPYEASFFKEKLRIQLLETQLDIFADRICKQLPSDIIERLRACKAFEHLNTLRQSLQSQVLQSHAISPETDAQNIVNKNKQSTASQRKEKRSHVIKTLRVKKQNEYKNNTPTSKR